MIWAIVALGALFVVAVALTAIVSPAKLAIGLLGTGVVVSAIIVVLAVTSARGGPEPIGGSSHAQLEADRVMTEQMAIVAGLGMESQMAANPMLQRSANDAYLRALEQHTYQLDRMMGRVP